MKVLLFGACLSVLLVACSNDSKPTDKSSEEVTIENPTLEAKKEKVTTEQPSTEKPTTESATIVSSEVPSSEETAHEEYPFISADGHIDYRHNQFSNYLFNTNHRNDFGGIKVGMSRSEVESMYGQSSGEGDGAQFRSGGRYGVIVVMYDNSDKVQMIALNDSSGITYEDIRSLFGEPSYDWSKDPNQNEARGSFMHLFIYDANKTNGYAVVFTFNERTGEIRVVDFMDDLPEMPDTSGI